MAHKDEPLPLSRLQLAHDLLEEYRDFLPELPLDEARRIGGEQEIIARYEPDKAVATLPSLLRDARRPRAPARPARSRVARQACAEDPAVGGTEVRCSHAFASVLAPASGASRAKRRGNGSAEPTAARKRASRSAKHGLRSVTGAARHDRDHRTALPGLPARAALRDGTAVGVRAIRPDDKERLRIAFARLSPRSVYQRFFHPVTELTTRIFAA